jgi:acetyl esterase/lipase
MRMLARGLAVANADSESPLLANLWLPPASMTPTGLGLANVNVGGWKMHTPDAIIGAMLWHVANQGQVVLSVDPRTPPATDLPAMVADVRRAIAWLKTSGSQHGVRADRIVFSRSSAGGHLAMLAAWADAPESGACGSEATTLDIRDVVSWYGPSDLRRAIWDRSCRRETPLSFFR